MTRPSPTHLLTEYLCAVSSAADEPSAAQAAVDGAVAIFAAPVCAVIVDGALRACSSPTQASWPSVVGVAPETTSLVVDGLGELHAAVMPIDDLAQSSIFLARGGSPFSASDRELLAGMAQALGLALRAMRRLAVGHTLIASHERESNDRFRLLDALGTRQRLLETVLGIQRLISNRRPLQEVLDAVTAGAASLLDRSAVALVLARPLSGNKLSGSKWQPISCAGPTERSHDPAILAAAAEAMETNDVVTRAVVGQGGSQGLVAAPVVVRGVVAGGLAAEVPSREGNAIEQRELLTAFSQQVSLALAEARDAKAVYAAYHDEVTRLPNKVLFQERLHQAIQAAEQQLTDVTVILVDICNFKSLNDRLGHNSGDSILTAIGERIRGTVRSDDLMARVGGDQFGILLQGVVSSTAVRIARSVVDAVARPLRIGGKTIYLSACAGVASQQPAASRPEDLFNSADLAVNRASQTGAGRIEVYEPRMHTEIMERISLLDDLQAALTRSEMRLQYQPLIDLATGAPIGVEALARWHTPSRGEVKPSTFIPLAEETGLILELGLWILQEGCRQVAEWRSLVPTMRLNLNISARQALDPEFVPRVAAALVDSGLPGSVLTLELTEPALMDNPDLAMTQLHLLKGLGVRLSVDDFGTGRSSLSFLRRFPIDQIKIDRAVVLEAAADTERFVLTQTIMDLGRTLRLETVAEGIEDMRHLDTLKAMGCDLGQGFLLARPMEPHSVTDYFRSLCLTRQ